MLSIVCCRLLDAFAEEQAIEDAIHCVLQIVGCYPLCVADCWMLSIVCCRLLDAFAEEQAIEDAIYYLGEALRKNVIELEVFLKVRPRVWERHQPVAGGLYNYYDKDWVL